MINNNISGTGAGEIEVMKMSVKVLGLLVTNLRIDINFSDGAWSRINIFNIALRKVWTNLAAIQSLC